MLQSDFQIMEGESSVMGRRTIDLAVAVDEDVVVEFWSELGIWHDAVKSPVNAFRDFSMDDTVV